MYKLMCYGCLHEQVTVTGEVLVALEIQGSIKPRTLSKEGSSATCFQRTKDSTNEDLFANDDADLSAVRVYDMFLYTPGSLCISIEISILVSLSFYSSCQTLSHTISICLSVFITHFLSLPYSRSFVPNSHHSTSL